MTVDDLLKKKGYAPWDLIPISVVRELWNAATAAERQRCREIVDDCGRYVDIVEMLEKIG